jgi:uncharacterized protein YyaL (SSP411 family)
MEHESFENEEIAGIMNDYLVCVKVDREERPDVDHVYMDAVHQIHGSGGWPLNCFALPDGKPFWGGTYFRPEQWKNLIENINELFHTRFDDLEKQAADISLGVGQQHYILSDGTGSGINTIDICSVFSLLQRAFDAEKGGLRGAPKFPMPVILKYMLEYSISQKEENALELLNTTLQNMAYGGIYDQVGGGFSRYSTDSDWKVPHFEKMLYDNAQLISIYSAAFLATGKTLYKDIIEQTVEFINRELTSPEGVFYSALDADSEGEEGLFYTWTKEEFDEALGHYAVLSGEYYGVGKQGQWENGRNILLRPFSDELFAQQHYLSVEELTALAVFCRNQLLKVRSERIRPGLDDKVLLSWNAQMISALVDAAVALNKDEYLQTAVKAANFILHNLKRTDTGLYHTWKNGKSQINAFLDDYAFLIEAFIKLYSYTADVIWLKEAERFTAYVVENLYDSHSGFFWYSENEDNLVFARKIEIYDGVVPSGNSVMANVLFTMGTFLHKSEYIDVSKQMLQVMETSYSRNPASYSNWASLSLLVSQEVHMIAVIGPDSVAIIKKLKSAHIPGVLIFGSKEESNLPYFENRFIEGQTLIYVCSGTYCLSPVETVEEAVSILVNK